MIPLCDLVPSRIRPVGTWSLMVVTAIGTVAAQAAWIRHSAACLAVPSHGASLLGPVVSGWCFPNTFAAVLALIMLWLFGPTVEDRLGHVRFIGLWAIAGLVATAAQAASVRYVGMWWLGSTGAVASVIAAYLTLFPKGRVLTASPVLLGFEFVDVPAWAYGLFWLSLLPLASGAPVVPLLIVTLAGIATGGIVARLAARPERMRATWWYRRLSP